MEYSIQDIGKSALEIALKVDGEEWTNCIQEAYKKTKSKYKVQGFRKGKVPFDIIEKRYGIEVFYEDALDYGLQKFYKEIVSKENLDVITAPDIETQNIDNEGFNVVIFVEVYPKIDVKNYKGVTLKKVKSKFSKKLVDEEIKKTQENWVKWVEVQRAAKDGDKVNLDYSGSVDGVKFDGGTAENQELILGSKTFIPGFEEQLVNSKIGDAVEVKVVFPEDYHSKDLAGKEAVFDCLIKAIQEKKLPELDDEFAKDLGDYQTFEEYKAFVEKDLKEKLKLEAKYEEENQLIEKIVEGNDFEIPQSLVNEESDRAINDMSQRYAQMGLKLDDFLKYTGKTMENLYEEFEQQSAKNVKTRIVLEAIMSKEKIQVEKEEFEKELDNYAKSIGKTVDNLKKEANQEVIMGIMNKILIDKLIDYLRKENIFE